jgi:hypothetical protein
MAAGLGFKTFTTGEVLTADNVNGYLMQGVLVFASAAARDAAITSPQEGQCCYLKDTDAVQTYSGSAWVGFDDSNAIQNSIVDAKGDIVAASGNDTPARLAVGTSGSVLVSDSAATTGLNYIPTLFAGKNAFINSNFGVWQRGTSVSVSAGATATYTSDRFALTTQANQASTVSRQTTSDTTNLPTIQYCARVQRNSGQTGTGSMIFGQSLETSNSLRFAGQTVTLSFYARAGSNYSPTSSVLSANIYTGTGTDQNRVSASYTGDVQALTTNATLTTTWQRFSVTGSIAATATELAVIFISTMTGTASTNDYYEVTGVQIENGSTATSFQTATGTIQGELAACQRYYIRYTADGVYSIFAPTAVTLSSNTAIFFTPFPVEMRIAPTSIDTSTLAYSTVANVHYALSAVTLDSATTSKKLAYVYATGTGMTGTIGYFGANNSTSAYIGYSAEL